MATTRRKPLSRERILAAALELVDEQGIDALSMRKLGQSLGYEAMSLYNHVANKDDLLDGILDLVLAEMEPPDPAGGLPRDPRVGALGARGAQAAPVGGEHVDVAGAHPPRPDRSTWKRCSPPCASAGLSAETTYHAYHVLDAHIIGFSLWASTHGKMPDDIEDARAWFDEKIPVATLPYLHEHGLQHLDEGPHHDVSAFEFALDLLLGGLERLR